MAGSSSITPKRPSPSPVVKRFKLDEANRTLPLVRRIVTDIVKAHELVLAMQVSLVSASADEQAAASGDYEAAGEKLKSFVDELAALGCQIKDFQTGLVDFLGRHDHRDVCLCWKLGEDRIAYWHELNAGFAGRQPVSTLKED